MTDPDPVVWRPGPSDRERSVTARFMAAHSIDRYEDLVARSAADPEWFWDAVVAHLGIPFSTPYTRVRDQNRGVPWTTWFDDGRINASVACVDRWADDPAHADRVALVREHEDATSDELTFAELAVLVGRTAAGLADRGVRPGDPVALLLPMADAVVAFLAVARLGAVAVPVFTGFGPPAVTARLVDAEARWLITTPTMDRRGRPVPLGEVAATAARDANQAGVPVTVVDVDELTGTEGTTGRLAPAADTGAEDPLLLAYTSGTTGRPKGAVHVHGGLTVKLAQEGAFQADFQPGDRVLWITDMGWIMGPWLTMAALANGAAVVTFDGAPDWPDPGRLWRVVQRHRVTFLGVSPTLVRALAAEGTGPLEDVDLSSLRAFGSTGEPWNPEPWWWLFRDVGQERCPIVNISGGTEAGACLLSVNLLQGIKPCALGGPALGVDVAVLDDDGGPVPADGSLGELVVRGAWPGTTRGIWGDPDRYLATYWSRWPDVWVHGDWASVDAEGFWYLHGRSDDTLNIAGKRIGPAEVESAAVGVDGVIMAAAVGLPHPLKGEVVGLWLVLAGGTGSAGRARQAGRPRTGAADDPATGPAPSEVAARASDAVVAAFGKAFRPAVVEVVDDLPRTRSQKIVRRAVRARATGVDPGDLSTLENPAALEAIGPVELPT